MYWLKWSNCIMSGMVYTTNHRTSIVRFPPLTVNSSTMPDIAEPLSPAINSFR